MLKEFHFTKYFMCVYMSAHVFRQIGAESYKIPYLKCFLYTQINKQMVGLNRQKERRRLSLTKTDTYVMDCL